MTWKPETLGVDRIDRKGKLARHNIRTVEDYHKAIAKATHLTKAQKAKLLASPQIPPYDRESVSPNGGAVW